MDIQSTQGALPAPPSRNAQLMSVAQSLEAAFLADMLKAAGVGESPDGFGGGVGEDQFASFLREEQAREMTRAGGIGLAQALFDSMVEAEHE